jgi:hypothetical protein
VVRSYSRKRGHSGIGKGFVPGRIDKDSVQLAQDGGGGGVAHCSKYRISRGVGLPGG